MSQVEAKSDKQMVVQLLQDLPDDCTLEDIQYRLYVMQVIQRRSQQADAGDFVAHEDVKKLLPGRVRRRSAP